MMQADEKVKRALAWECVSCLQGACQGWWELNLYEGVSEPMGGGRIIGERVTLADSILRKIMALLPLTVNCLRGYLNPLRLFANLNRITDTSGQTCSPFEIQQLLDWLSSHYSLQCLCNCQGGPGQSENGYLSITVPPSHPLSSSERCTSLLIFSTCQKLGEQLLGRTATLLNLDTSQLSIINHFPLLYLD